MTQPPNDAAQPSPADDAAATEPSLALADVWDLLDVLPTAEASPDLLATTIEMAAVSSDGVPHRTGEGAAVGSGSRPGRPQAGAAVRPWLPAAIVLASLVAGIALGRVTAPTPDAAILANLPIVQHLDLLREAGSVTFLEAVAKRGYSPPRRPPPAQSKADVREDAEAFDAAIAALRAAGAVDANRETLAARREQVLRMPEEKRRQLERSAETFQRLTGADRSELVALGRALADPGRGQLLEAARLWHLWVQFRDPADRRDVIDLAGDDRLEWLDRSTRIDARQDQRPDARESMRAFFERERDNRRRPPPEFQHGPPEFRQGPPPERRPGPPGPPGPWWDDRPPGPPRPRGPGQGTGPAVNGREPPSPPETPEPPR